MRLNLIAAAASVGVALLAGPAAAHEDYVLDGTVTRINPETIEVTTAQGETFTIETNRGTRVAADTKALALNDLKVGHQVHIDGYGDQIDYMLALAIQIVPAANPGDGG